MSKQLGPVRKLWFRWKSLRLPWRKRFLVGFDLGGNSFWEFRDQINAGRMRRIVEYANRSVHYADVKVSPQWMQWLRYTRAEPPSLNEQQLDQVRQIQLKQLAAEADARWASQPSFLSAPSKQQSTIASMLQDPGGGVDSTYSRRQVVKNTSVSESQASKETPSDRGAPKKYTTAKESPWQKFGKDAEQQPEPWTPKLAPRS